MPPAAAKNCFVILFDMRTQCRASALNVLSKILLYKKLSCTKDAYKIFLVNAAKTSPELVEEGIFCLEIGDNIATILDEIQAIETGQSDWLQAMAVAMNELMHKLQEPGIINLQLLFITDLSSFNRPNDGKLLDCLINNFTQNGIFLYVVGPDIEPSKPIFCKEDIQEWMDSVKVDSNNSNLKIMKKIITNTPYSVMCNYDLGIHLFNSFQFKKGMQPWQVPLTFGTNLTLPVSTIRITKKETPFNIKSTALRTTSEVKWVYEDQEDVELDFEDVIGGLVRHGKFVKIETDGMFKVEGPRSFSALLFTSAKNVPEYLLQSDGSYMVVPSPNQSEEFLAFYSDLVDELVESEKYIIARRVYNRDFNPKFVALIPTTNFNTKGLLLCELPYADDIAHDYNEVEVAAAPPIQKIQAAYDFLDSININSDKCKIKVPLVPEMMVDPNSLNIIKKVEEKIIKNEPLDKKFNANLEFADCEKDLKNEWPVRELLKIKKEECSLNDFNEVDDFTFD